ncbi:MAG: HD domain-containing protein [Deltaproteobacteria bacterium]|nr:HD domain-containing protein [Deltaproteobacteria bacterium]MBN2673726.1 HD domain-containing protein [Deltaproteobacteria bacterium]
MKIDSVIPQTDIKHNILCIDDDPTVLSAISRDFQHIDATLTVAGSAEQGLAEIEKQQFSLIISDLKLPGADGIKFLHSVSRRHPDTVRILISGQADFNDAVKAINQAGLFGFMPKPWEQNTLLETVQRALEHYEMTLENKKLTAALSVKCTELGIMTISLEKEVQARTTSMLLGMVNALDLRDTETHWHSRRVALFSRRLAEEMDLDETQILEVERGSLLHDVGKIGVSDTILLKPGKLTEEEWVEMKRHAEYGYQILKNVEFLFDAKQLVWQHHERWDGGGYPRGLKETDIYVGARIFAIIDTYDAMTSDRPYRKALSHEIACKEINDMKGRQFDPDIVDAWNRIPESDLLHLRELTFSPTAGLL